MMRNNWLLVIALALGVGGCADDETTVLADVQWTLSCSAGDNCRGLSDTPTCLGHGARRVQQFDSATVCDDQLVRATCLASNLSDTGNLNLDLEVTVNGVSANTGDDYVFAVDRLVVDPSGAIQESPSCIVRVVEDESDYGGRWGGTCGTVAPSPVQPCQIVSSSIQGRTVDIGVVCEALPSGEIDSGGAIVADVRGPGTMNEATLHFENCNGL